jgi:predicted DNA-binding protein
MTTGTRKRVISVALPPKMDDKIEYLAEIEARSKAHYIRCAIEKYLAEYPEPTPAA